MKGAIPAVAAVAALVFASAAHADSIRRFRVVDTGSLIKYGITVCSSRPHTLRFTTRQVSDNGSPIYRGYTRARGATGCDRWVISRPDMFSQGLWYASMNVAIGGRTFETSEKAFYID